MAEHRSPQERENLLADVSEMYYLEGKTQDEIAQSVGVTRSMVSRMLTEARQKGIVDVRIRRPLQFDHALEDTLKSYFHLLSACVVEVRSPVDKRRLSFLGKTGAEVLKGYLSPGITLGIAWGTSISAVVNEIEEEAESLPIKIVQLVGALGTRNNEYDGHGLVQRLAEKIGGEAYYLNAPFLCPSPSIADSLMNTPGISETVAMGKQADVALVGVGSIQPEYSSFYLAGYVPLEELEGLIGAGAVGDVCGLHFDLQGKQACADLCERLVTIREADLFRIPVRIGVAGGPGKARPILGALRGGYLNVLVTDSLTARMVLDLVQSVKID